jgi:protein-L-isoaspartate(D-aspartate) O-methyltransferase
LDQFEAPDASVIALLMSLRSRGIRDTRVLSAIEKTPRDLFVDEAYAAEAFSDRSLPIACGQTISQPFLVASMAAELALNERHKVLEIGTGSGYHAAILARLCQRVYTVERYRTLSKMAQERFAKLKLENVTAIVADGADGWPQEAPYDRILVTAAAAEIPLALTEQLAPDGLMVLPLGDPDGIQNLIKVKKTAHGLEQIALMPVRFVPLVAGTAREL